MGTLLTLNLHVIYQHPSGIFSQIRGTWTTQDNGGYQTARADVDYWQWDWLAGYRFPRRRAEIVVGVLNLTDRDYRLSPLNLHVDTPRARTFTAQFRFQF
jgi:outer membrane receptor protein involved in Fe transport